MPVIPVDEFCGKIKAGKDSQSDDDFSIVARVEALIAGWDMNEALRRAEAYREAGADAITLHLREDRRHIQEEDVFELKELLQTRMNLEMAVTESMIAIAEKVKPHDCCLVPESREELTTEGGLDVAGQKARMAEAVG